MNKVALITGAGTGIGRACAIALSDAGYDVVLTGRRIEALEETKAKIKGKAICVVADVTDAQRAEALALIRRVGPETALPYGVAIAAGGILTTLGFA